MPPWWQSVFCLLQKIPLFFFQHPWCQKLGVVNPLFSKKVTGTPTCQIQFQVNNCVAWLKLRKEVEVTSSGHKVLSSRFCTNVGMECVHFNSDRQLPQAPL